MDSDSVFTLRETDSGVVFIVFIGFLSFFSKFIYPLLHDFLSIRPPKNSEIE